MLCDMFLPNKLIFRTEFAKKIQVSLFCYSCPISISLFEVWLHRFGLGVFTQIYLNLIIVFSIVSAVSQKGFTKKILAKNS